MIHGPPEIASLAVDPDENLIHVPPPLDVLTSRSPLPVSKFGGEDGSEAVPPEPDRLKADVDAPFVQQVFDLAQRQREPDVEQDRSADHRWRAVEITERITHPPSLPGTDWIRSEFALTMPFCAPRCIERFFDLYTVSPLPWDAQAENSNSERSSFQEAEQALWPPPVNGLTWELGFRCYYPSDAFSHRSHLGSPPARAAHERSGRLHGSD